MQLPDTSAKRRSAVRLALFVPSVKENAVKAGVSPLAANVGTVNEKLTSWIAVPEIADVVVYEKLYNVVACADTATTSTRKKSTPTLGRLMGGSIQDITMHGNKLVV